MACDPADGHSNGDDTEQCDERMGLLDGLPMACDPAGGDPNGDGTEQCDERMGLLEDPEGVRGYRRSAEHLLFGMNPRHMRTLLLEERQNWLETEARHDHPPRSLAGSRRDGRLATEPVPDAGSEDLGGRLVIDPCLGRVEVLCAKAGLGVVILGGLGVLLFALYLGQKWLSRHVGSDDVPWIEATLVLGVGLPALLSAFLMLLEHSEWAYVRRVSPQTRLAYTPSLHIIKSWMLRLRRWDVPTSGV